jgi:hypothetical protein
MEMIDDAWTRFKNNVDITSRESHQLMDVSKADFDRSEKPKGAEWLHALSVSGQLDAAWFEEYVEAAQDALEAYKKDTITLQELDTRLELPEAPVRPDVSHLDPEYSFNSHSQYRKSLPVEDRFVEVNDRQIGGYTNSSKADTDEGTGTTLQLTHSSKESSKPGNSATRTTRKKPRRKPFTADQLAAQHQAALEKEKSKLTYAEMLSKPAPSAKPETEDKGTEGDQSVVSSA